MNNRNMEALMAKESFKKVYTVLFWILIIGMPLHTMLIDKMIGSTIFSFGGLLNLWRDLIILFFFVCAAWKNWRETLLSGMGGYILGAVGLIGLFWLFSEAPFTLKTNILRIYVIPMLMVFVMQTIPLDEKKYDNLLWVLFLQGVGIALFGLFQVFVLGEGFLTAIGYGSDGFLHHSFYIGGWSGYQRLVATFASPNNCGLYLTQLFAICWVNRKRLYNYSRWANIGFLVILVGTVATFSRSAWVSLFVVVVVHFIIHEPNKKRLLNWKNAGICVGVFAAFWLMDLILLKSRMTNMILSSILGVVTQSDASFMKHLEDFITPIGNVLRNPFGYGFGLSGPIALSVLGEGTRLVESAVWLVGYDIGVIGLIAYFFPYIYTIREIVNKKNRYKRTAAYLTLAVMIIFCILPLHQNIESTFLVFMFMGLAQNPNLSVRTSTELQPREKSEQGAVKMLGSVKKYVNLYASACKSRDRNLMLFGAWFGKKYDDNPRYLFEYVVQNCPQIKAVWMTADEGIYQHLKEQDLPVCMCDTEEGKALAKTAKYIFTATGRIDIGEENLQYLGGAYYINLWHGLPLKKIMYDDVYSESSRRNLKYYVRELIEKIPYRHYYVVSTSNTITNIYESAFRVKRRQILQLGQPRNDCFFREHENVYCKRFEGKRIILYMPTHRNEGATAMDMEKLLDLEKLNAVCEANNAVFLIKKHFYHAGEPDVTKECSCIFDITNEVTESQNLLDAAAVLITDYSSCYIDYLLLDRPIVFYNFDAENYEKNDRQLYFNYDEVTPGEKCATYAELEGQLAQLLAGQDAYPAEREKVRDLFYCKQAQKSVSEAIIAKVRQL